MIDALILIGTPLLMAAVWLALTWRRHLKKIPWVPPQGTYPKWK